MSATRYAKANTQPAKRERTRRAPPAGDPTYLAEKQQLARRAVPVECASCGQAVPSNELELSELGSVCERCADQLAPDIEGGALRGAVWSSLLVPIPGFLLSAALAFAMLWEPVVPGGKSMLVWVMVCLLLSLSGMSGTGVGIRGWRWSRLIAQLEERVAPRSDLAAHAWAVALGIGTLVGAAIVFGVPMGLMLL